MAPQWTFRLWGHVTIRTTSTDTEGELPSYRPINQGCGKGRDRPPSSGSSGLSWEGMKVMWRGGFHTSGLAGWARNICSALGLPSSETDCGRRLEGSLAALLVTRLVGVVAKPRKMAKATPHSFATHQAKRWAKLSNGGEYCTISPLIRSG